MGRKTENIGFVCEHCGGEVLPATNGCIRDHCPFCLRSKHLDETPGDRMSDCGGIMDPVGLDYKPGKGWQIVFSCRACGRKKKNKTAEDTIQPDDLTELLEQMKKSGKGVK